jgi:SAM-dependent methyltransferase
VKQSAKTELLSVALATAAMLLAEILLGGQANFVFSDEFNLLMPVVVFGALAMGSLLGLIPRLAALDRSTLLVGVALSIVLAFVGLAKATAVGVVWIALPIAGFGVYLTRVFSDVPLRQVVWALGLGGVLLYVAVNLLVSRLGVWMPTLLVLVTVLAALARRSDVVHIVAGAFVLVACVALSLGGGFDTTSYLERRAPGLAGATRIRAPIFTPLIRTDLLRTRDGAHVMLTNGSRYAVLPPKRTVDAVMAGERNSVTYQAPYFAVSPKNVLVIGSAEGMNVVTALARRAESVVAVDINPAVFEIARGEMAAYSGGVYSDARIETVVYEGRHYAETTNRRFDLITIQGVQSGTQNDLLHTALLESYLFTDEAMQAMWRILAPNGALYIDEYERKRGGDHDDTLIGTLAGSAARALGLADPAHQCIHYRYRQGLDAPNRSGRWREAVLLLKTPLDDAGRALAFAELGAAGARVESAACIRAPAAAERLSDDRPFFTQRIVSNRVEHVPLVLGVLLALVAAALSFGRRASEPGRPPAAPLLLTGVGYIVFVLGVTGPATLLLGDPQLTTPVVFVAMYLWGLGGGLLALRSDRRRTIAGIGLLVVYLVGLAVLFPKLHAALAPVESSLLRGAVVGLLLMPAALLAELPYIYLLGLTEGPSRGRAFVWENVGTLFGLLLGLACQVLYGFHAALLASAAVYVLALVVILRVPAVQPPSPGLSTNG